MTFREIVRNRRRREIHSYLQHCTTMDEIIKKLKFMPPHLRATAILDLEEFLQSGEIELAVQNPWWQTINLKKMWKKLKENHLA